MPVHRLPTYREAIEVLAHYKCVTIGKAYHRPLGQAYSVDKSAVGTTGISQQHLRSGTLMAYGNHRLTAAHIMLRVVKKNLGSRSGRATSHDVIARQKIMTLSGIDIFERDHCHRLLVYAYRGRSRRLARRLK